MRRVNYHGTKASSRCTFYYPAGICDEYAWFLSARHGVLGERKYLPDVSQPQSPSYGKVFEFALAFGHRRCHKKQIAVEERTNFITGQGAVAIAMSMVAD
jgi:hypothetical protein